MSSQVIQILDMNETQFPCDSLWYLQWDGKETPLFIDVLSDLTSPAPGRSALTATDGPATAGEEWLRG